jgi:site-specific DNA-methyltransferase (adenine-specific)
MREYGIRVGWKPMLWFVKGTRDNKSAIVFDTVEGAKEKEHHDWEQHESDAAYYIKNLSEKGDLICDPFLGGGTTAVAAEKLKRRWLGFEIDEAVAKTASKRLSL